MEHNYFLLLNNLSRDFYENLLNNLQDGIYFLDKECRIRFWNQGAERITGFKESEVLGKRCSDNILIHVDEWGRNLCQEGCPAKQSLKNGKTRNIEAYLHHKEGYRLPVYVYVLPVKSETGEIIGVVETFHETLPKVSMPQRTVELERMELLDPLTQVGNRRYLEMQLNSRLEERRRSQLPFGVLFIDIDDFKTINNSHGRDVGNKILKMVSKTLSNIVRFFDVIGRWGEEEFLVILLNVDKAKMDYVANRFRLLVRQSQIMVGAQFIGVTVSIGATLARLGDKVDTLIKRAEELMYRSKSKGKDRVSTD